MVHSFRSSSEAKDPVPSNGGGSFAVSAAQDDRVGIIIQSAQQVGPAIFGSLSVMIASFMPVFLLTGPEGKLFKPLAYTKTFAMVGASVLAITLVPVLMTYRSVRARDQRQH
jgi:Cu/Ag efflux pump CusA